MALPSSGSLSLSQVRTEAGQTGTFSLGGTHSRSLAGIPTGSISLSDLYGKSSIPLTIGLTVDRYSNGVDVRWDSRSAELETDQGSGVLMRMDIRAIASGGTGSYNYSWSSIGSDNQIKLGTKNTSGVVTEINPSTTALVQAYCTSGPEDDGATSRGYYLTASNSDGSQSTTVRVDLYFTWYDEDL